MITTLIGKTLYQKHTMKSMKFYKVSKSFNSSAWESIWKIKSHLLPLLVLWVSTMVAGKNKCLVKGLGLLGQKGAKKRAVDSFSKRDWYDVKATTIFNIRNIGKILVRRTQRTKIPSGGLKGHVFEVNLDDLQNDEAAFRKFKLICSGKNCLISIAWILPMTKCTPQSKNGRPWLKLMFMSTLLMVICFIYSVLVLVKITTIRLEDLLCSSSTGLPNLKMMEIMSWKVQTNSLKEVVNKLTPDSTGKDLEKACQSIYPLLDVC